MTAPALDDMPEGFFAPIDTYPEPDAAPELGASADLPEAVSKVTEIPFRAEGPQPLLREIPPGEPYPIEALGALREAVEAAQGKTLTPFAIPAASALTVAALALQGHVNVETLGSPRPVSLYALTIARSGERKSSSDEVLMAGLREYEKAQATIQSGEIAEWQNAVALWKGQREIILGEAKKSKGSKRAEAEADLRNLGREPGAPPFPGRTVNAPTIQGITRQLREGMPTLGIFSDEGGRFLGGYAFAAENKLATMAALNDLWQGADVRVSLGGEGSYVLYGRRMSAHLMVQPGVARALLADPMSTDTGLLPRFLMAEPESTIGARPQSVVRHDDATLARFSARLRQILDAPLPMDPETRALEPRLLRLSPAARALLVAFADHVELEQAKGGEYASLTGFASKAAEQAARIAGVLTAWQDLDAREVTQKAMADGIALAQYYLREALRLADEATVSAEVERAEALRKWLLTGWTFPEVLPSDVIQRAPIRGLRESPAARAAIGMLEKHGWLARLPDGAEVRGKRRKEAYRIVRAGDEV